MSKRIIAMRMIILLFALVCLCTACATRNSPERGTDEKWDYNYSDNGTNDCELTEIVPDNQYGDVPNGSIDRDYTGEEEMAENVFWIQAGDHVMTAEFADNPSAEAFRGLLAEGPVTVEMSDYGDFEKVGELVTTIPRSDEKIVTEPGDVILYLGDHVTIYYDVNTWNFTRLGKIGGQTAESMKAFLGDGDVTVTFSLPDAAGPK